MGTPGTNYADYVVGFHKFLLYGDSDFDPSAESITLSTNLSTLISDMLAVDNPYRAKDAFNPEPDIERARREVDRFRDSVEALDVEVSDLDGEFQGLDAFFSSPQIIEGFRSYMNLSETMADDLISEQDIAAEVAAYAAQRRTELSAASERTAEYFASINGMSSTALPGAVAQLEGQYAKDVATFEASLREQDRTRKAELVYRNMDGIFKVFASKMQIKSQSLQGRQLKLQGRQSAIAGMQGVTNMQAELAVKHIGAMRDMFEDDLTYDIDYILWYGNVLEKYAKILGAPVGLPAGQQKSRLSNAMGGLLSGATSGIVPAMAIGAINLPAGIAVEAAFAAAGLISGLSS